MKPADKISKFLTYAEAIKSQTAIRLGIKNDPDETELARMKNVATKIFDKVRIFVDGALNASSFFRSKALNDATPGSSLTSQHMTGEAIDIDCDTFGHGTNKGIFDFIRLNLEFDQLIWEYGDENHPDWVHVSLSYSGKNRRQILRCHRVDGKPKYVPFDLYKV